MKAPGPGGQAVRGRAGRGLTSCQRPGPQHPLMLGREASVETQRVELVTTCRCGGVGCPGSGKLRAPHPAPRPLAAPELLPATTTWSSSKWTVSLGSSLSGHAAGGTSTLTPTSPHRASPISGQGQGTDHSQSPAPGPSQPPEPALRGPCPFLSSSTPVPSLPSATGPTAPPRVSPWEPDQEAEAHGSA